MGTNFYLVLGDEEIHIGKRFAAGGGDCSFVFYAATFDSQIKSWRQWRNALEFADIVGGKIVSEYSEVYSLDKFINEINEIPVPKRKAQYEMSPINSWIDDETFSFSDSEFS